MLDTDYLGELNIPDGLPGLYDQPVRQRSPGTRYLAASRPAGNVVKNCEILPFFVIPDIPVWPPTERALCQRP
eukprot:6176483-Pleurochrysis_carterae.AAC.1